jgi:hypothetical protein
VEKYIGDVLMCGQFNERPEQEWGVELGVRIGVNITC